MAHSRGPLPDNRKAPPERVLVAIELLGSMRPGSVRKALKERFSIGETAAKRAMAMARLIMDEEVSEKAPHARAQVIARLERIVDRAEEEKDFSAAVRGMRELVNIYGLSAPDEVRVTIDPNTAARMPELTEDELRALAALDGGANLTEH